MSTINKKAVSDHYREAVNREDLQIREAAKFLNINPCYLSMAINERFWDSMSKAAWDRLNEWHESRGKISEFIIPEGEDIFIQKPYVPKEKKEGEKTKRVEKEVKKTDPDDAMMHLPELKEKKERKKIVNLVMNKAEIEALDKKFTPLFEMFKKALAKAEENSTAIGELRSEISEMKKDAEGSDISLKATWTEPEKKRKRKGWSVVIFQRNIYQK